MSQPLGNTNLIPNVLTDAKVYRSGGPLIGIAKVTTPKYEFLTETINGLGIAGEVEAPVKGHLKSMALGFTWNTTTESAIELLVPEAHQLEIYANIQYYDAGKGTYEDVPAKILSKAVPKSVASGNMEPAKKMDAETELEVYYLKYWIGGKEMIEADKFNYIFKVNGVDYLARVRANLGMDY